MQILSIQHIVLLIYLLCFQGLSYADSSSDQLPVLKSLSDYMTNSRDQGIGISPTVLLENSEQIVQALEDPATDQYAIAKILNSNLLFEHIHQLSTHLYFNQSMELINAASHIAQSRLPQQRSILWRLENMRLQALGMVGYLSEVATGAQALLEQPDIIEMPVIHRDALNLLAEAQLYRGYPTEAIALFQRTLALPNATKQNITKQQLDTYFGLTWSYSLSGLPAEAKRYAEEGLSLIDTHPSEWHEHTLYFLTTLSWLSAETDNYKSMHDYFDRLIIHIEKSDMRINRVPIGYIQNLVFTVAGKDRLQDSADMLDRSIAAVQANMTPSYPYLAHLWETKTRILDMQLDHEPIGKILTKIDTLRSVFPVDHPEHAYSLFNRIEVSVNSPESLPDTEDELKHFCERILQNLDHWIPVPSALRNQFLRTYALLLESSYSTDDAQQHFLELEALSKKSLGADAPGLTSVFSLLAGFYQRTEDLDKSTAYFKKADAASTRFYGIKNISVSSSLLSQADNALKQGNPDRAMRLIADSYSLIRTDSASALSLRVQLLGSMDSIATVIPINRNRYLSMLNETLDLSYQLLGKPNIHSNLLETKIISELTRSNRFAEAEARSIAHINLLKESIGLNDMYTNFAILSLAQLYGWMGEFKQAEDLYKFVYQQPLNHPKQEMKTHISALKGLASLQDAQELPLNELQIIQAVNNIESKERPDSHKNRQETFKDLARINLKLGQWDQAYHWISKVSDNGLLPYINVESPTHGNVKQANSVLRNKIFASYKVFQSIDDPLKAAELSNDAFKLAQRLMKSEATVSVAKTYARTQQSEPGLDSLARRYETVKDEIDVMNQRLIGLDSQTAFIDSDAELDDFIVHQRAAQTRFENIRNELREQFPSYLELVDPAVIRLEDIQSLLNDDEVVLVFLELGYFKSVEQLPMGLTWAISANEVRWVESIVGGIVAESYVTIVRCGVDASRWQTEPHRAECEKNLTYKGDRIQALNTPHLPFDLEQVQQLHDQLFKPIESFIADKKLLIITHGALAEIPFSLLVKERPSGQFESAYTSENAEYERYQNTRWLIDDHALAHYPSVSALHTLRTRALKQPGIQQAGYLAFANPLLAGNQDHPVFGDAQKTAAEQSLKFSSCAAVYPGKAERFTELLSSLFRRGASMPTAIEKIMTRDSLMRMSPLPETAHEVCQTNKSLSTNNQTINLGIAATESSIKALDTSGELASYDVVHFATHGLMAGENGSYEAGLVMTPPENPNLHDDGYLSASEIAGLRFNADWVILSACNTAGGGRNKTEPLSGLASAFFYANARSLLVSHWQVVSEAAVELVTGTVASNRDSGQGRAEALRTATLELKSQGGARSHPSYWAPFVIVGESR